MKVPLGSFRPSVGDLYPNHVGDNVHAPQRKKPHGRDPDRTYRLKATTGIRLLMAERSAECGQARRGSGAMRWSSLSRAVQALQNASAAA